MRKILFLFLFLTSSALAHYDWHIETRAGIGPAWHEFLSIQHFDFGPALNLIQQERIITNFDYMPYFQGSVRGHLGEHFNIEIAPSGGFLHHGRAIISDFAIEQFVREVSLHATIAIVDVHVGFEAPLGASQCTINPLIGYAFNKQKLYFAILQSPNTYSLINTWGGPYIGLEGTWLTSQAWCLRASYKAVFGQMSSRLAIDFATPVGFATNPPNSIRHASNFGDIFAFEAAYNCSPCWRVGTNLNYTQYRNHTCGRIELCESVEGLRSTVLQKIFWEQLSLTFFAEYVY